MVRVTVHRDTLGRVKRFTVEGHAGLAEAGEDIVCAAASALTQAAVIGLEEYLGLQPKVQVRRGWLDCRLPEDLSAEKSNQGQAVLETMILGLKSIAASYGQNLSVQDSKGVSGDALH